MAFTAEPGFVLGGVFEGLNEESGVGCFDVFAADPEKEKHGVETEVVAESIGECGETTRNDSDVIAEPVQRAKERGRTGRIAQVLPCTVDCADVESGEQAHPLSQ